MSISQVFVTLTHRFFSQTHTYHTTSPLPDFDFVLNYVCVMIFKVEIRLDEERE